MALKYGRHLSRILTTRLAPGDPCGPAPRKSGLARTTWEQEGFVEKRLPNLASNLVDARKPRFRATIVSCPLGRGKGEEKMPERMYALPLNPKRKDAARCVQKGVKVVS